MTLEKTDCFFYRKRYCRLHMWHIEILSPLHMIKQSLTRNMTIVIMEIVHCLGFFSSSAFHELGLLMNPYRMSHLWREWDS